ncbi:MAG TPA: flagellar basal body L-ring protein FlgH [Steroidobacteraceae bacterium]|jgi:flagellar L-ring protein precursor FlgH
MSALMQVRAVSLRLVAIAGVLALCGCSLAPKRPSEPKSPPMPEIARMPQGQAGGVFSPDVPWTLLSDNRAFRPGDALTVVLQEVTQASKSADTTFAKQNDLAFAPVVVGGKSLDSDLSFNAQREFAGSASSTQQNALRGSITVLVQEVLPNGLLRVSGEKTLRLNQGEEFIRVAGYVRVQDIDTENRVSSQRIANADIAYSGRGTLHDANAPGWLARFFSSSWMPF